MCKHYCVWTNVEEEKNLPWSLDYLKFSPQGGNIENNNVLCILFPKASTIEAETSINVGISWFMIFTFLSLPYTTCIKTEVFE